MQIIAGTHKGRKLLSPFDKGVRPTSSKMREAVFNILTNMNLLENTNILDLCCGTGALGIEAISRGAKLVLFIDGSSQHLQLARANIEKIQENDKAIFLRANAEKLPKANQKFDLIFLDPPYHKKVADKALISLVEGDWLNQSSVVVVEQDKREDLKFSTQDYKEIMNRIYGNSKITLLEKN